MAAVSSLAVAALALSGLTLRADNLLYDLMARAGAHPQGGQVVIVAIDNRSIRALGRWPWPRGLHAALLDRLRVAGARAVAYDVLFVDPDRDPAADAALASAVAGHGRVVLPVAFEVPGENGAPFRLTPPIPPLRAAAAGLGHVDLAFDADGVVRRAMLAEDDGRTVWPALAEAAFRLATGRDSAPFARGAPRNPDPGQGLFRSRPMLIPYAGPPGTFRTISFVDLLRNETPAAFLRDRIVLVGATADGLGDRYATPLSGRQEVTPGVEVQANVLDALLSGREARPAGPAAVLALALVPLWLLLAGFLRLRPRANMALGAGLVLAVLLLSAGLLAAGRLWLPPASAVLGLVLVYPFWSWRRLEAASAYMIEELERFGAEPELLPSAAAAGALGGDVVARELELMRAAVGRMRELRRFVDDTLQGLPDATLVSDRAGRVVLANRAAAALFAALSGGGPEGRVVGELLAAFQPGESEDELAARGAVYQLRREPLRSTAGEAIGEIVRLVDVTALKTAARQREQVLQLLTHDMRSPQVSILALLQTAAEPAPPALARRIEAYARRTLALADDFVHLARAESAALHLEPVDLGDLMVEAADDLWPQAEAKGVAVQADPPPEPCLVLGDRSLLSRALVNLVGNAVKYTDPGGRVRCEVRREGGRVLGIVSDTGRGLDEDQRRRLFEPFHRGAAARGSDGVGLGLAFVHAVAQRHGATLDCTSAPGQGAAFTLALPEAPPDP